MTKLPDSNDRQIIIGTSDINDPDYQTKYEDDINFIRENLILRLDKDFVGTIDLTSYLTVTQNNKFSSATDVLKFNVTPVADTPIITLTDRSSIDGVDIEGVEDLPIRFFQTEDGDNILSLQTTDERNTETLSLIVRKQVDLLNSEEEAIGNFVDAQTLASIGKTVSYDFGNLDDNGDPIGPEDAFEFSRAIQ